MTDIQTKTYYRVGGNLPPDAPCYVTRKADEQLYQKLKEGELCYVLNSRQMGKSSLWVRVKQRLEREDCICAAIDLSGIGQGDKKEWYASFASRLVKSFAPELRKKWRSWRKTEERQGLASTDKLHQLIEELLLPSLLPHQQLIIFIDEIDYVKGLPFSTDEFFALIRSCYNERSINPQFNKVTFCLLGVATPADLIKNKQLTPFNIGTGIELQGFRENEAKPLIDGLKGKVTSPKSVMSDILYWTGGQPFLTQRLCNLVLKENNPNPNIPELVQRQIVNNWEIQDEQEHLRTIKERILSNEQRSGYLLELYRQVLKQGRVLLNNSSEERELQLSGLVVKRNNALEVYNPIYAKVFNESWINSELAKLRPYSENYRAWIQSRKTDASRLLRGQALQDAEAWASGQNLGGEDRDFLGASRAKEREEEIAQKEKEAELERERKARESAEQAKRVQTEANQTAQRKIRRGSIILSVALLLAGIAAVWGSVKFFETQEAIKQKEEAITQEKTAKAEFKTVRNQLNQAQKKVNDANQRVMQAQENQQLAEEKTKQAEQNLQTTKQASEQAEMEKASLDEQVKTLEKTTQEAEGRAEDAQELAKKARQEVEEAKQAKIEAQNTLNKTKDTLTAVKELSKLAVELREKGKVEASDEAFRKAGLSILINNEELKQAWLIAATAEANPSEGENEIKKALDILDNLSSNSQNQVNNLSEQLNQVKAFAYFQAGELNQDKKNSQESQKHYQEAYEALKESNFAPYALNEKTNDEDETNTILTEQDVEDIHYRLIKSKNIDLNSDKYWKLIKSDNKNQNLSDEEKIAVSFIKHLLDGLEFLLSEEQDRLKDADLKTTEIMLYIADESKDGDFSVESLQNFSCPALREIDELWYNYPKLKQHFGFRVQKEIWKDVGSPEVNSLIKEWRKFYIDVGWKTEESGIESGKGYVSYDNLGALKDIRNSRRGNLPFQQERKLVMPGYATDYVRTLFVFPVLSRAANCNL